MGARRGGARRGGALYIPATLRLPRLAFLHVILADHRGSGGTARASGIKGVVNEQSDHTKLPPLRSQQQIHCEKIRKLTKMHWKICFRLAVVNF